MSASKIFCWMRDSCQNNKEEKDEDSIVGEEDKDEDNKEEDPEKEKLIGVNQIIVSDQVKEEIKQSEANEDRINA